MSRRPSIRTLPAERRQLHLNGPSILWRDDPVAPGRREGLCFSVRVCAARECPCRDVHVVGVRIDEAAESVAETAEGFSERRNAGEEQAEARYFGATVDITTGEVTPSEKNQHPDLFAWFAEAVDGELLDHLHGLWMRAKGYRAGAPRADADLSGWRPGEIVFFDEVFLDERQDLYAIEGRTYLVTDGHCVNPACTCAEACLSFALVREEGGAAEGVGTIVVDMGAGTFKSEEPVLRQVWARVRGRHRLLERLTRRRARLLEAVPALLPASRPEARRAAPGRNAPCPCGSGAKYKRCCIGKAEWT
jgi:hypothetical protein